LRSFFPWLPNRPHGPPANGRDDVTITPFTGEKDTTYEGGMREPCIVRWPSAIQPGTIYNDIMSQEDCLPTFLHAAGVQGIVGKLKEGYAANPKPPAVFRPSTH
jgi:arylsulfatase A-like enzyme